MDREKLQDYYLNVLAKDMPDGGPGQRSSFTQVHIRVLDVNDTPPKFAMPQFSAVVAENANPGTPVIRVEATDPDLGDAGRVRYAFPEGARSVCT